MSQALAYRVLCLPGLESTVESHASSCEAAFLCPFHFAPTHARRVRRLQSMRHSSKRRSEAFSFLREGDMESSDGISLPPMPPSGAHAQGNIAARERSAKQYDYEVVLPHSYKVFWFEGEAGRGLVLRHTEPGTRRGRRRRGGRVGGICSWTCRQCAATTGVGAVSA